MSKHIHSCDACCRGAAQAAPAYKDSTPELHISDSAFESWYSTYSPAHKSDKQRARDAYAAGMGDPLVTAAPTAVAGLSEAVKFTDQSTADPVEKARRYLTAMGSNHLHSSYFFDDGYPKQESTTDALATLAVMEHLAAAPATQPSPQQEAQEPCSTCAALARTVMLDQVSFDRKPDCYGIRQITDDEGVEEWDDIRTSPDVASEEANDMMATGRGEIYEVVPLWTTPQLALQPAPAVAAGCTRSHPHENMGSSCRAKTAIAEMQSMAVRGAEATAQDLERFVSMASRRASTRRDRRDPVPDFDDPTSPA